VAEVVVEVEVVAAVVVVVVEAAADKPGFINAHNLA
jgi:hypothetical protein